MISRSCCRFALRAVLGVLLILARHNALNARMTDAVPPDEGYRTLPGKATTRHYAWEDINSRKVLAIEGDREIVDARVPALRFELEVVIDPLRLRKAIESYGIPETWMRYSYRSEDEKRQKEKEQALRCAARGIARGRMPNSLEPDYCWVVENSREDVREAAVRLRDVGRRAGYDDFSRFVELLASFVQSLQYRVPPDVRRGPDGTPIQTCGLTMPLETLFNGHGDCDTKSVLFASLMTDLADTRLILVRGANHIFAGVRAQPRPLERYVRLRGENYVLIELTSPWRVGHIPMENWHAVELKQMEIIPLFR
jgi:hypothetical protein